MKGREHPISQPAVLNPAVATHKPQVGRRHKLGYFVTNLLPNSLSTTALNRPRHKQSARIKPSSPRGSTVCFAQIMGVDSAMDSSSLGERLITDLWMICLEGP